MKNESPFRTVLTITVGFTVIYLATDIKWILAVALGVGLIGIFSTYLSEKIHWLWMKLSWVLSLIVPNIVLSLIFYLILFPLALMSRIFGKKDPLMLKANHETTFREVSKDFDKVSFERMF